MNGYALANTFRTLRESWRFTSTEADLYYELVGIANERGWPTGFQYSNQLICATIGISEKSLIAARNRLKQAGLLDFVSGHKRAPTSYTLSQKGLHQVSKSGSKKGGISDSESDSPLYKELKQNETELKKKLESEQAASAAARLELEKVRALVDELAARPAGDRAPSVAPAPPLKAERGGKFQKPTKPELVDYLLSQQVPAAAADALATRFLNYYDSNGWKAGRNAMKDWQATARNWAADKKSPTQSHATPSPQQPTARYNTTARGGFGGFAGNAPAGRHHAAQPVAGVEPSHPAGGTAHTPGGIAGGQNH